MKKGYWVVAYRSVSDESALKGYAELAGEALRQNGGKGLVRTSDMIVAHESGQKLRTVVIEFESFEKAVSAYESEPYRAALKVLGSAADRDFRIVEGVE